MVTYGFDYSEQKDLILRETRGVGFTEVIEAVKNRNILDDLEHTNKRKYPNQRLLIVEIKRYAYVAPYVIDKKGKKKFLKTVYPSRDMTKKYMKGKKK